jgi:Predicted membrane protein
LKNKIYDNVSASPLFEKLVQKRNRFAVILSVVMLGVYYAYVLFASSNPAGFGTPIAEGSKIPVGLLFGWGIQAFAFVLTGIYVFRANSEFDAMTKQVVEESSR